MRYLGVWCGALLLLQAGAAPAATLRAVASDGTILLSVDLTQDPCWTMRWNHSVTGNQVDDYYCLRDRQMLLTASHTPRFDAGLGHLTGRGKLESDGNHGYWIRDIDEPVPGNAYWLRVGSAAVDHRVVHKGREYSLSAVAANQRVRLRIEGE